MTLRDHAQSDGTVPGATLPVRDVGDDLIDGCTAGALPEPGDGLVQKIAGAIETLRGQSQRLRVD